MASMRRVLLVAALLLLPAPALAQEAASAPAAGAKASASPDSYLRTRDEESGVTHLELATRVLEPVSGKGPRIHLVAAVHVADAPFYAAMQERLDALALVLFEGVRPSGAEPVDPAAGAEERVAATRRRLDLLVAMAEARHAEAGAFPEDPVEVAGGWTKGKTNILDGILEDGWGRKVRYARRPAAEGAPEVAVFTSDGADGKPGTAGEPGDDLRAEATGGKGGEARGAGLQSKFAAALGVAFQLDVMDSSGPRWRSSDMGVDELQRRMEASGVDSRGFIAFLEGSSAIGKMAGRFLDNIAGNPKLVAWMKMLVVDAVAMEDPAGEGGPGMEVLGLDAKGMEALMRIILVDRNTVVLADLRGVLARESDLADVGIFYGAAHMKDLETRITAEMGYRPGATSWTVAMSSDPAAAGYTPEQAKKVRAGMKKMLGR